MKCLPEGSRPQGRVEECKTDSLSVGSIVHLGRGGESAPFPEAPFQTGRADFPHPADRDGTFTSGFDAARSSLIARGWFDRDGPRPAL